MTTLLEYFQTTYVEDRRLTSGTHHTYGGIVRRFANNAPAPIENITPADVDAWCSSSSISKKTAKIYRDCLASVLRHAHANGRTVHWSPVVRARTAAPGVGSDEHGSEIWRACVDVFFVDHPKSPDSRRMYRVTIERFSDFLGRAARFADLSEETLGKFHSWMMQTTRFAPQTATNYVGKLKTIWLYLSLAKVAVGVPQYMRRIKPIPLAADDESRVRLPGTRAPVIVNLPPPIPAGVLPSELGIVAYFDSVYLLERPISNDSACTVRIALKQFAAFSGELKISDIIPEMASRWVMAMATGGKYTARTVHGKRGDLLVVLRHAWENRYTTHRPERVRKVRLPAKRPDAWSIEQFRQLLAACDQIPGVFDFGPRRSVYFRALLLVAWDTGLRRSDLFRLSREDLAGVKTIVIEQHKTGTLHAISLSDEAARALAELLVDTSDDFPLNFVGSIKLLYECWETLRTLAGIGGRGALQMMRRTAATAVEISQPGMASKFLGHTTPGLAAKHYIDPSKTLQAIRPPSSVLIS